MGETISIQDLAVGQELPELDLPITAAMVVGGALASRDYTPVHHERSAAVAQGWDANRGLSISSRTYRPVFGENDRTSVFLLLSV